MRPYPAVLRQPDLITKGAVTAHQFALNLSACVCEKDCNLPTLTTIRGLDLAFRADAVVAVSERDPESGAEITCVYGLGDSFHKISEPVDGFLSRIGLLDKFAKFTRPNGASILICAPAVTVLTTAQEGLFGPEVKTVIIAGAFSQAVKESLHQVRAELAAHGGAL
ncbi:MAG TPA: hypothetical protein VG407_04640 [Caulobacteraceae bacterium]|nr:hypothetical protein [Caulobacteraceae bacterium]